MTNDVQWKNMELTAAELARQNVETIEAARERLSKTLSGQVPNELPPLTDYDRQKIGGPVRITLYPTSAYNLRQQIDAVIGDLQKARESTYPVAGRDEASLIFHAKWHISIAAKRAKDIAAMLIKIDRRV